MLRTSATDCTLLISKPDLPATRLSLWLQCSETRNGGSRILKKEGLRINPKSSHVCIIVTACPGLEHKSPTSIIVDCIILANYNRPSLI
jgi:hypothetical protein